MKDTPLEKPDVADDRPVSVTALSSNDDFWLNASEPSLDAIWDNCEDDVIDRDHAEVAISSQE